MLIGLLLLVFLRADRVIENEQTFGADHSADELGSFSIESVADPVVLSNC